MRNKKLCLLFSLMLLGLSNFAYASDIAVNTQNDLYIEENDDIKGNKAAYDKAIEAMGNKDFSRAISYLNAYISSKPKKYEAYKLRGDCYYAMRNYRLALQDYQMAVDLKASDDKLMTGTKYISAVILGADKYEQLQNPELGNLYARLMYAQKAVNDPSYELSYNKALEYNSHIYLPLPKKDEIAKINCPQKYGKILNPKGVDEFIYGAIDQIEKQNYTDAIFKSQYITSNYPNYYLGYYLNGVALEAMDKSEEAIIAFNKALSLNKSDFESLASLGRIYFDRSQKTFSSQDARKSIDYFNQALKYNENCYVYYFYIALNELQLGNIDTAILNFNKAIKLKQNDYNSLYYKSIAQYLNKDYQLVIDAATKLLYKHVSNYNSVLYLRALSYYKLQEFDKASADLDAIIGNMNDIYNADVRELSSKEKTLENYVYYLKAQIALAKGDGAKSDLEKAYVNPILKQLALAKDAIKPYEQVLSSDSLLLSDYKKFNAFYSTGFPKLLESGVVITENDVDNQYDYIRTTFDDMGLSFVYVNPDYKLTTIKDFPYKKYYSKLSPEDIAALNSQTADEIVNETVQNEQNRPELKTVSNPQEFLPKENDNPLASMFINPILAPVATKPVSAQIEDAQKTTDLSASEASLAKHVVDNVENAEVKSKEILNDTKKLQSTTPQEETLIAPEESSLAKMLATGTFGTVQKDQSELIKSSINAPENLKSEVNSSIDNVKDSTVNDSSADLSTYVNKSPAINEENAQSVKQIMEEEKSIENNQSMIDESVKFASNDDKTMNSQSDLNVVSNETILAPVETETKPREITEKHANIDLDDIGIKQKEIPIIKSSDEVIILDTSKKTLYSDEDKQVTDSIVNNKINKSDELAGFDVDIAKIKSAVESQVKVDVPTLESENLKEEPAITLPEDVVDKKIQEVAAVPVVNVPEVNIPKVEKVKDSVDVAAHGVNDSIQNVQSEVPVSQAVEQAKELISEPAAEIIEPQSDAELENFLKGDTNNETVTQIIQKGSSEDELQIAKEKIEIDKIRAIEEAQQLKEQAKAEKIRLKEELKKQKELAKAEAKAKKEQIKAEKLKAKEMAKQLKEEAKKTQKSLIEQQKSDLEDQNLSNDLFEVDAAAKKIEKEKLKAEKNMEKKIKAAQKAKEKAEAKALKEQKALERLLNMYPEFDSDDSSEHVKRTVIKKLED